MSARLFRILLVALGIAIGLHRPVAADISGAVWVSSEDNGDKPGVEFRAAYRGDGKLSLEMWLFGTDENGKIKERVRFPITLWESDAKSILFEYQGGDKKKHRAKIVFGKALTDDAESAVRIDVEEHQETKLVFRRSHPEK